MNQLNQQALGKNTKSHYKSKANLIKTKRMTSKSEFNNFL